MPEVVKKGINRKAFYLRIRETIFGGRLSQLQVDGMEIILNEWESRELADLRWLAYILGTIKHETAGTFQPIAEYGKGNGYMYSKPDPVTGKIYYGRGFCQLTWKRNYQTFSILLGIDLVNNPDLALDCKISTDIIFEGMIKGLFTRKKLSDYFDGGKEMWITARRIVNGSDAADIIATYGIKFHKALLN